MVLLPYGDIIGGASERPRSEDYSSSLLRSGLKAILTLKPARPAKSRLALALSFYALVPLTLLSLL